MKVAIRSNGIVQDGIAIASKPDAVGDLIVTITVKTMMDAATMARVVCLQKQKSQKYIELGSDQALMDIFSVGIKSEGVREPLSGAMNLFLEDEPFTAAEDAEIDARREQMLADEAAIIEAAAEATRAQADAEADAIAAKERELEDSEESATKVTKRHKVAVSTGEILD